MVLGYLNLKLKMVSEYFNILPPLDARGVATSFCLSTCKYKLQTDVQIFRRDRRTDTHSSLPKTAHTKKNLKLPLKVCQPKLPPSF